MGVPVDYDARIKSDGIRISGLEQVLAERTEKLQQVSELFHDFLVKLCAHDPASCPSCANFKAELGKLVEDCPGVRSWFTVYKTNKATRDEQLRNQALSRMSMEEARALGVWTEWDICHNGYSSKDRALFDTLNAVEEAEAAEDGA